MLTAGLIGLAVGAAIVLVMVGFAKAADEILHGSRKEGSDVL